MSTKQMQNSTIGKYLVNSKTQLRIDRVSNETPVTSYTDGYQETILRNLWLAIIRDHYPSPIVHEMEIYFSNHTLVEVITAGMDVANHILFKTALGSTPFVRLLRCTDTSDPQKLRRLLLICRFGKRYTPNTLPKDLSSFWETNDRLREYSLTKHSVLFGLLRRKLCAMLDDYRVDWDNWSLSTGNDADGSKCRIDKLYAAEKYFPSLLGVSLGTPMWNIPNGMREFVYENRITSVPKAYNKVRHIALEPQWMAVKGRAVARAIEDCLPEYADIHDQSHNLNLARAGSKDNSLATIDLSAASDSVSLALCREVLPENVLTDILSCTSRSPIPKRDKWGQPTKHYDPAFGWVENTQPYQMISTMGNRVTFPLETLIFSAILEVTADLIGERTSYYTCGVYGDDIICPNHWYETLVDVLDASGFIVNSDKSFSDNSFFRESCGGEYLHGETVASIYWPRKALNKGNALAILIPLQHKLYFSPYANEVLCREIRRLCPKITESYPDSPYDDIWSEYPDIKRAYGSYQGMSPESEPSCEVHTVLNPEKGICGHSEGVDRYQYYEFLRYGHRDHEDPVLAAVGYPAAKEDMWAPIHPRLIPKNRKFLI